MIDVYYWTTPNGHKITIFLEEAGLPYNIKPVNIGKGEQFKAEFLAVSPNNRIPAMVDQAPAGGGKPIAVFESGAILLYLAEKTGQFLSRDLRARTEAIQWLFWQMGNLGPMAGQNNHFNNYAVEKLQYAMDRYRNEVNRLYGVLNAAPGRSHLRRRRLFDRRHGDLSLDRAVRTPGPEARGFPASQALVRSDPRAAGSRARLREGEGGQSRIWAASARRKSVRSCSARPRPRSNARPPARGSDAIRPCAGLTRRIQFGFLSQDDEIAGSGRRQWRRKRFVALSRQMRNLRPLAAGLAGDRRPRQLGAARLP